MSSVKAAGSSWRKEVTGRRYEVFPPLGFWARDGKAISSLSSISLFLLNVPVKFFWLVDPHPPVFCNLDGNIIPSASSSSCSAANAVLLFFGYCCLDGNSTWSSWSTNHYLSTLWLGYCSYYYLDGKAMAVSSSIVSGSWVTWGLQAPPDRYCYC